jgi:hypothetical protein
MKCVFDNENVLHCLGGTAPPSESYSKLVYFKYENNTWSSLIKLDDTTSVHGALALNSNNEPRAVWWTFMETYLDSTRYRSYGNNQWSTPQIIAGKSEQHALFVEQNGTEHLVQSEKTATGYDHAYYMLNDEGWNRNVLAPTSFLSGPNKLIAFDTTLFLTYCHPYSNNVNDYAVYIRKRTIEAQSVINGKNHLLRFEVFPNPAHTLLNIQFLNAENSPVEVLLFDINGKNVLKSKSSENQSNIICNIEHLSIGLYYIVVKTKTESTAKTIVITK